MPPQKAERCERWPRGVAEKPEHHRVVFDGMDVDKKKYSGVNNYLRPQEKRETQQGESLLVVRFHLRLCSKCYLEKGDVLVLLLCVCVGESRKASV